MTHHPFETVIVPGYIVDLQYRDEFPPPNVLSSTYDYYRGYFHINISVTQDNLSVAPQAKTVFLIAPTSDTEGHGTQKLPHAVVIPINRTQSITHVVFGCKALDIGDGPADFDTVFFMLSDTDDDEDTYGGAWVLFKHDKEETFFDIMQ
jgi:hypothetical protein